MQHNINIIQSNFRKNLNGLRSPLIAASNKERVTKSLLHANCLIKGRRPSGILEIRYKILYNFWIIQHVHLLNHTRKTIYHILIITYLIENDMIDHMQTWIIPVAFVIIRLFTCCPMSVFSRIWEVYRSFCVCFIIICRSEYYIMKRSKNILFNFQILNNNIINI